MVKLPLDINQEPPTTPSHYPLVYPDPISDSLISHFYLSFVDPEKQFQYPFRLAWLTGFGYDGADEGSEGIATGRQDLLVVDKNDLEVCNTSLAAEVMTRSLLDQEQAVCYTWVVGQQVCRIILDRDAFPSTPSIFLPRSAVLDCRTLDLVPARLGSISAGGQVSGNGNDILLQSGFNTQFRTEVVEDDFYGRRTRVYIRHVPGDGVGQFDGCDKQKTPGAIYSINNVFPNDNGDIYLNGEGCVRIQRPGEIIDLEGAEPVDGRTPVIFSATTADVREHLELQLESQDPAHMDTAAVLISGNESATQHALEIHNNCAPCCDCADYSSTYQGLIRADSQYRGIGQRSGQLRQGLRETTNRWYQMAQCVFQDTVKLTVSTAYSCRAQIGGVFQNLSPCCLTNVKLRITVSSPNSREPGRPRVRYQAQNTFKAETANESEEVRILLDEYPGVEVDIFEFDVDVHKPNDSVRFQTVLVFPECGEEEEEVDVLLSVHAQDSVDPSNFTPEELREWRRSFPDNVNSGCYEDLYLGRSAKTAPPYRDSWGLWQREEQPPIVNSDLIFPPNLPEVKLVDWDLKTLNITNHTGSCR